MTISLDLPADVEKRLRIEAKRQGRPVSDLAAQLLSVPVPVDGARAGGYPDHESPLCTRPLPPAERDALIDRLQAAYAGLPLSVNEYLTEKHAETAREDRE